MPHMLQPPANAMLFLPGQYRPERPAMRADKTNGWSILSDEAQLALSREALQQAADTMVGQAEILAEEMRQGTLADRGGPEALTLLAAIVRATMMHGEVAGRA
jgi:hypothetical protein